MQTDEKILLVVAAVALVAVIIFQRKPDAPPVDRPVSTPADLGMSFTPATADVVNGPAYLVANAPYQFMPPIDNWLPTITAGQGSQTVENPSNFVENLAEFLKGNNNG